jgi:hypothetical protein
MDLNVSPIAISISGDFCTIFQLNIARAECKRRQEKYIKQKQARYATQNAKLNRLLERSKALRPGQAIVDGYGRLKR